MASLSTLKRARDQLLLKPLDAVVFLAPWYTPIPDSFTDTSGVLQPLPSAYTSVGLIAKSDGIAFARNIQTGTMESYGELEPTRLDVTSDSTTLAFTPQEANKLNLQLTSNADLSAVMADPQSGEVFFAQPSSAQIRYYSAVVIGRDGSEDDPIYIFKVMPKVAVSQTDGETWNNDGGAHQKLTLTAFKDSTAGYAVAHGFAGSGWKKRVHAAGFDFATTTITVAPTTLDLSAASPTSAPLVVTDQDNNVIPADRVQFTSSATAVATVSATGVVSFVSAGSATVTATHQGKTAQCTVTCT
ncbi:MULTISPECIES: Ig-like domain-containing protein [unclassified Nocardia]|uniref:Ig-like domain-containing protein n=1 Tax=unclassified Nocardia TaxID=2637762 RepID=UPI00278C63DC|nr:MULTISPECIES: Ig-like domain-containing protein [unclassified Nocardia]